jgi:HPt (histidine-containing phosphotransfer) domain-containing protein
MNTAPIVSELLDEEPEMLPLVERFVTGVPEHVARLRLHFQRGEWERLRDAAHELKGTAGNMGFPSLMKLADGIEKRAAKQSPDDLANLLSETEAVSARIRSHA